MSALTARRRGRHVRRRWVAPRRLLLAVSGLVATAALGWAGWLAASGCRVVSVTTPSMSPQIPVASLVVTSPLTLPAHPGAAIVFHPPGDGHLYVHRVVDVGPGPTYRTEGDNDFRPDPWVVPARDVVGRAAFIVPDAGWLVRAGPILAGALGAAIVVGLLFPSWRRWAYLDAGCGALLLTSLRLRPFVRWQLAALSHSARSARAWLFDTGILPIEVQAHPGTARVLAPGHAGTLLAPVHRHVTVVGSAAFSSWQWALVALVCAAPVLHAAVTAWRLRGQEAEPAASSADGLPGVA